MRHRSNHHEQNQTKDKLSVLHPLRRFALKLLVFSAVLSTVLSGFLASTCYAQNTNDNAGNFTAIPTFQARAGRVKPIIVVIADNRFTELTDYVVPYSVLQQANIADVFALGMQEGAIQMFPALRLRAQLSALQFDTLHPTGADYVIVPAVHYSDDPALLAWVREQAKKGATIVGICDGVWVLAHAGLLEHKQAVGHWYSFDDIAKQFPRTQFIKNKRFLADGKIVTSTGVSASLPASMALVEAIAGKAKANAVAAELGITDLTTTHRSADFKLSGQHLWTASWNWLSFCGKDKFVTPLTTAVDELRLALTADAFSRTYRSSVWTYANESVTSLRGLHILPDMTQANSEDVLPDLPTDLPPGQTLDWALQQIAQRYGERSASFVALQMEYPYRTKK